MMADSADERRHKITERFWRVRVPFRHTPEASGIGVSTLLHGFRYDDFNRAGIISFPKLCKYTEILGRNTFRIFPGFENCQLPSSYVVGSHIDISVDFYQTASMMLKMRMVYKLARIGNSSFSFHTSVINENSGQVIAVMVLELVNVNVKSGKPEPLNPVFRQKANRILDGFQLKANPRLLLPSVNRENCYCCKITVRNLDMDMNYHTTQLKYVDYALECAARATESGHYKKLKGDICDYCVKKSSFVHIAESRADDELLVMTWEDQLNPMLLYFVVTKEEKDLCHAKMEFYDPHLYSNL